MFEKKFYYNNTKNISAYFWQHASNEQNNKTIILIHGFRGSHHGLQDIARNLDKFNVIIMDLPGYGISPPLPNQTHNIENYIHFLYDFIQFLDLKDSPILFGHSFGSIITAAYSATYPKTVDKLILLSPIGNMSEKFSQKIMLKAGKYFYKTAALLPQKIGMKIIGNPLIVIGSSKYMTTTKDKTLKKHIYIQHKKYFSQIASPTVTLETFISSTSKSLIDFAHNIKTPTLVITTAKDNISSIKQQKIIANIIANSEIKILEKIGHLAHYEAPQEVAQYINNFLTEKN